MVLVDKYYFDIDRMLFISQEMSESDVNTILNSYPITDPIYKAKERLSNIDFDNLTVKNKYPTTGGICLTYNCQLRCIYCSFCSAENNSSQLSLKDIEAFVSYLIKNILMKKLTSGKKNILKLFFSGGGEPTYDWDVFVQAIEMIDTKCKHNNITYELNLTTNGMLNDAQIDFISRYFKSVMISFDGLPSLQLQNRKPAAKDKSILLVEQTIRKFLETKIEIVLRSTVWGKDFSKLTEMCEYVFSNYNGIFQWSILPTIDTGRAKNHKGFYSYDEKNDFLSHYLNVLEYARTRGWLDKIDTPFFSNGETVMYCGAYNSASPWLLPDGSVVSCLEAREFKPEVGKVRNGTLQLHDRYKDIVSKTSCELIEKCSTCIAYRFCRGGCPLKFLRAQNGSRDSLNWECEMIRSYWKYIFEKVLQGETVFGWYAEKLNLEPQKHNVYILKKTNY